MSQHRIISVTPGRQEDMIPEGNGAIPADAKHQASNASRRSGAALLVDADAGTIHL